MIRFEFAKKLLKFLRDQSGRFFIATPPEDDETQRQDDICRLPDDEEAQAGLLATALLTMAIAFLYIVARG